MFETMQKIAIALMVGAAAVGAVRDWSRDVPSVTADYYTQTRTGGEIEARYTAMGSTMLHMRSIPPGMCSSSGMRSGIPPTSPRRTGSGPWW